MEKILIIEDDQAIAELERDYLQINGFSCDIASRGPKGLEMALNQDYALIIVDIMLPGMDGFDICRELRKTKQVPVIFLSAKGEEIDKIKGLGLGADDYMTKPFSPNELVARVKAHISRHQILSAEKQQGKILERGDLIIDTDARRVTEQGQEIILTAKEYDLLLYLAQNPNRTFTKEGLFDKIWGMDAFGDISTVTVHIQRIREKLGKKKYIETVWGVGYRFSEKQQ